MPARAKVSTLRRALGESERTLGMSRTYLLEPK